MDSGYIYVLSNPSFMQGVYKIGFTTRNPEDRMAELQRNSGVPTAFELEYSEFVLNCESVEGRVHANLADYRVNPKREFFKVSLVTIIRCIREISDRYRQIDSDIHKTSIFSENKISSLLTQEHKETNQGTGMPPTNEFSSKVCQYPRCYNRASGQKGLGRVYCLSHSEYFVE